MSTFDKLAAFCAGSLVLIVALIIASPMNDANSQEKQPTEPSRPLCEEVAHELNLWYQDGEISREDATRIIDRCFATFGPEL